MQDRSTDKIVEESAEVLLVLFNKLELTAEEKAFVNIAARKLANLAWELLMDVPVENRARMRGIITSLAIAMAGGADELR